MERGLHEEPVEYGVLMPSPQLTQQVVSIGMSPIPLKVSFTFHTFIPQNTQMTTLFTNVHHFYHDLLYQTRIIL